MTRPSLERRADDRAADVLATTLVKCSPHEHVHVVDLPWRLGSWAWPVPGQRKFWSTADGQVQAWACLQTPFWSLDYAIHPDAPPGLLTEVVSWADDRARAVMSTPLGRPTWLAFAFADQTDAILALEAAGFEPQTTAPQPWSMVLMRQDPSKLATSSSLPAGFTLRPLAGASEATAYVALHRAIFNSDSMTEDWRRTVMQHPSYDPDLDLVVTDPDGDLAALCVGWLSATGPDGRLSGQIEPLGVDARYRGRGLGNAIATECLRRMYSKGAVDVYVETDSHRDAALALYESVGYTAQRSIIVLRKDYRPANSRDRLAD
jgi:ribosomal protein S18 acetylase RimI-like enzyme